MIHNCDSVEPRLRFFLFFFLFLHFFFLHRFSEPLNPSPNMVIYRKRPFGVGAAHPGELAQASWFLIVEGISSPRWVGCLRLKVFHGPDEPDASLCELGSRKFQKWSFCPFLVTFVSGTNKQLSKPCMTPWPYTVIGAKDHNSIRDDQNIISEW